MGEISNLSLLNFHLCKSPRFLAYLQEDLGGPGVFQSLHARSEAHSVRNVVHPVVHLLGKGCLVLVMDKDGGGFQTRPDFLNNFLGDLCAECTCPASINVQRYLPHCMDSPSWQLNLRGKLFTHWNSWPSLSTT